MVVSAGMNRPLNILLSNDDSVHAPGILAMRRALAAAGHTVTVCAPDRPRSATGHSITLHKPLRLKEVVLHDGSPAYACSGMPADCVLMGLTQLMKGNRFDCVVSGINHGPNLGWDTTYSGTVAAAMEGVVNGFQAVAVSMASFDPAPHWDTAGDFIAKVIVPQLMANPLPDGCLLNVNVPNLPANEVSAEITRQGERHYEDKHEARIDPHGSAYFWIGGKPVDVDPIPGTDVYAVKNNRISITPLHLDLTRHDVLSHLREWDVNA